MLGAQLVEKVIDPEILKFEEYFRRTASADPLSKYERDLLRAMLYWKYTRLEDPDEGSEGPAIVPSAEEPQRNGEDSTDG